MRPQSTFDPSREGLLPGGGVHSHLRHIKQFPSFLDVVAVVSNPVRYRTRYDLFRQFEKQCLDAGVRLTVVELAYGHRNFEITDCQDPHHVQLRTQHELWHKENLINLGVERLPRDWRYVAWVDADIQFANTQWAQETLQQLQHYAVVQLFSHAQDLGPNNEPLQLFNGFGYSYVEGLPYTKSDETAYGTGRNKPMHWHPGFAWAMTREAWDAVGGLIDFAVLGAGDNHMARALIGKGTDELHPEMGAEYRKRVAAWEERAQHHLRRNLGYVPGLINHYWHGKKVDRKYWDRWRILVDNQYDPDTDIKRDWQGVLQLVDHGDMRSIHLRDGIRRYFRQRNEDSTDL